LTWGQCYKAFLDLIQSYE